MISKNRVKRTILATVRRIMCGVAPLVYKMMSWGRNRTKAEAATPKRILLLNGAHIGDIVISTSILPVLRSAFPSAQIGFATGSWSLMVVQNHPEIAFTHCIDHWWLNRQPESLFRKIRHYNKTRRVAIQQIRDVHYDLALCLYPHFQADLLDVAWHAGIPKRIAFRHSLRAALATDLVQIPESPFIHQGAIQAELLRPLYLNECNLLRRRSVLLESTDKALGEVCNLLGVADIQDARYRIIHMGSGDQKRELTPEFWREIALYLSKSHVVVFTGRGKRESANIETAIAGIENCVNACDRLSWEGFVAAVRYAESLYGVESMAGHVAAAVGTLCKVVYTGIGGVAKWRPESDLCTVFSNHLACAPCNWVQECSHMSCLRTVKPDELIGIDSSDMM